MKLKLFTFLVLLLTINYNIFASASDSSEESSRAKTPPSTALIVPDPTPGKIMAQRQAMELTRERFENILGKDVVNSLQVSWETLNDTSLPFDHSEKRRSINSIHSSMLKLLRKGALSAEFNELFVNVSQIKGEAEQVHAERLTNIAVAYFSDLYPSARITSHPKTGGVQMGENIKVSFTDQPSLLYHVKTHSEGRLSEKSTAAKLVNPAELLAYKILEYTGFGCETHFCERSAEDVYIATLDAGQQGKFEVFEQVSGRVGIGKDENLERALCGCLSFLDHDPTKNDRLAFEGYIQEDAVAQHFISQAASLDILSRILRLKDLLNNPDNFGFVFSDAKKPALKVIDFRIMDPTEYFLTDSGFLGFLAGNGLYQYASSHKTMRFVLHDRLREYRIRTAIALVSEGAIESGRFLEGVENAYSWIKDYITSRDVFGTNRIKLLEDLNSYYSAIKSNTEFFAHKLQTWTPE